MATHFSIRAWRIPGMVEPGALPSMGSHRVGHDWSNLAAAAAAATEADIKKNWQEYTEEVYKKELHDSDNHDALLTHLECNAKSSGLKGHYEKKLMEGTESSCQVWMWEFDYKEVWAPKNWCFWTVVLEKTLESPLDCKEIQPVHPKGD